MYFRGACCILFALFLLDLPQYSLPQYRRRPYERNVFQNSGLIRPSPPGRTATIPWDYQTVFQTKRQLSFPTYTIVAPYHIQPNSAYQLSVNWNRATSPLNLKIELHNVSRSFQMKPNETLLISLNIGQLMVRKKYKLQITGSSTQLNFTREHELTYKSGKGILIFVQTDKAQYKPEQIVKFRVIVLKSDLVPVAPKVKINILIKDSSDNLIKKWKQVSLEKGLASRELQLSDQPTLGEWSIHVQIPKIQKYIKKFKIAEYVLPTFSVDIQLPKFVIINQTDIIATVKARYTFGQPVKGQITLTVNLENSSFSAKKFQIKAKLTNSSVDIPVNLNRDFNLKQNDQYYLKNARLSFHASVEEQFTGRVYNQTESIPIYDSSFKVELIKLKDDFKPGLPFTALFKVAYMDDTPVEDNGSEVTISYSFKINAKESRTSLTKIQQSPVKGLIRINITPPKNALVFADWRAEYRGKEYQLEMVNAAKSSSDSFIQVSLKTESSTNIFLPESQSFALGQIATFQTTSTEPISQLVYQVQSNGVTVLIDTIKLSSPRKTIEFFIKISDKMAPIARLLVYYIHAATQELVADSSILKTNKNGLFKTPVFMSSNVAETKPGGQVDITVLTNPEALIGLLGVDQSVLLLESENDITQKAVRKRVETVYKKAKQFTFSWNKSYYIFEDADLNIITNKPAEVPIMFRKWKKMAKTARIAKKDYNSKRRKFNKIAPTEDLDLPAQKPKLKFVSNTIRLRKKFSETWIWSNISSGSDGLVRYSDQIPDTITSWYISAFALDSYTGLGIAENDLKINVFRPFFVKLSLPYSIIQGESVTIQALVFNYQSKPVQARVTMDNENNEFNFVYSDNKIEDVELKQKIITIAAFDSASVDFVITPKRLGCIDISVQAVTANAGDALVRKLLVKPEGQTQHFNEARFIQLNGQQSNQKYNFSIDIPANAVPGSVRVIVSGISDILGPVINNFDDLLRMPYGCGEQNMINFVPNIVVLNYLTKVNRLTPELKSKALRHIETGYQRQLTYQRKDGSFSVFGTRDQEGSTWLTAYVVKSFIQARVYIDVDKTVIQRAIEFLFSRQQLDGSFIEKGRLLDKKMKGGNSESASGTITAYVLSAILYGQNSIMSRYNEQVRQAQKFIQRCLTNSNNPYEIALISYAFHLGNSTKEQKNSAFIKLMSLVKKDAKNQMFWTHQLILDDIAKPNKIYSEYLSLPNSLDVETTAYGLLTLMVQSKLGDGVRVLRWLISKQNSNGGFASTQDTVIGLQALGAIAEKIQANTPNLNMTVTIQSSDESNDSELIHFNSDNEFVLQQRELVSNPRWVELEASGIGSALVQMAYQYNIAEKAEKPAFALKPQLSVPSSKNVLHLNVCTSYYKDGDSSNMALMEIELPSGYNANIDTLRKELLSGTNVKRVDSSANDEKVFVYFDRITNQEMCINVPARLSHRVANIKPIPVTIYDYYDRSKLSRTFYTPASINNVIKQINYWNSSLIPTATSTEPYLKIRYDPNS